MAGCGTGILSLFCASAGAKKVISIECSNIASWAQEIFEINGAKNIVLMKGRLEELQITEKVDIIVSEWMGYFLLYESMFDSVIEARDKYLKPDGMVILFY